jgi:hypothetical protein
MDEAARVAGESPLPDVMKSLLEGRIRSDVTCAVCHTSQESTQPVWVMTLPVVPDVSPPNDDADSSSKAAKREAGKPKSRGKEKNKDREPSSKELKQHAKAQRRREKQLRKQHGDIGGDDPADGNLSGLQCCIPFSTFCKALGCECTRSHASGMLQTAAKQSSACALATSRRCQMLHLPIAAARAWSLTASDSVQRRRIACVLLNTCR